MAHSHSHAPQNYNRAFALGVTLNLGFVVVEAVGGALAGSLALLADAGHNLSDVLGLVLAWGAFLLAGRAPSVRFTYGLRRATILAALLSAVLLLVALGGIAWEALGRFMDQRPVDGVLVLAVAAAGVVVNTATALLFFKDRDKDLNVKGAFLHMAADAAVSLGVVVAGVVILMTGWLWIDPALSLLIAVVILLGTWGLLRDSLGLSLDAVPRGIDAAEVATWLRGLPGVDGVHDLHIWAMSTTQTALTAHLVVPAGADDAFLHDVAGELEKRFHIEHSTIQVERDPAGRACRLAPDCA